MSLKRTMPTFLHANPCAPGDSGQAGDVPSLPRREWDRQTRAIVTSVVGREVSTSEARELDDCAEHNWSLRVAVEHVLGRRLTMAEWDAARP